MAIYNKFFDVLIGVVPHRDVNAFYGSGAQIIYLPATVKTVWNYAFNGCPLSDIYFTHNVYIENMAFYGNTASLTIHCPSSCQDRNLRT